MEPIPSLEGIKSLFYFLLSQYEEQKNSYSRHFLRFPLEKELIPITEGIESTGPNSLSRRKVWCIPYLEGPHSVKLFAVCGIVVVFVFQLFERLFTYSLEYSQGQSVNKVYHISSG